MENDHTTFVIEMIAVCTLGLAGVLYQFHAWPHPWFLLAWAGVVFVGFSVYRGAAYTHRRFASSGAQPDAQMTDAQPPAQMSEPLALNAAAPEADWSPDDPSETDPTLMRPAVAPPAPKRTHPRSAAHAPSDTSELRSETHLDLVEPDAGPLPAFAESTLSGEERKQTLRTLLKDIGELKDPRENAAQEDIKAASPTPPSEPAKAQEDAAHDATVLTPIVGPPKKERPKKERPKKDASLDDAAARATLRAPLQELKKKGLKKKARSTKAADAPSDFDPRATVLEPGRAHEQAEEVAPNKRPPREPVTETPAKADSAQIGRRVQILDSETLDALRKRAAKTNPPSSAKDDA